MKSYMLSRLLIVIIIITVLVTGILFYIRNTSVANKEKTIETTATENDTAAKDKEKAPKVEVEEGVKITTKVPTVVLDRSERTYTPLKLYTGSEKPPEQNKEIGGRMGLERMTIRYGNHDYGCMTQSDYDAVMAKVDDFFNKFDYTEELEWQGYQLWLKEQAGESIDMNQVFEGGNANIPRPERYVNSMDAVDMLSGFKASYNVRITGIGKAYTAKEFEMIVISDIYKSVFKDTIQATDPGDGTPRSAADAIVRGLDDCDSTAQIECAVYDRLGLTSRVRADWDAGHGWSEIKMGKYWMSGEDPLDKGIGVDDASVVSRPTYDVDVDYSRYR